MKKGKNFKGEELRQNNTLKGENTHIPQNQ